MLHLAVCDDEVEVLVDLKNKILQILKNEVVISLHSNPFALLTYIIDEVKGEIDLVILDINMKDQNGIQVAETILDYSNNIKIIFMTKYIECVKDIFRVSPLYFLIKPIEIAYLKDALYKTIESVEEEAVNSLIIRGSCGNKKMYVFKIRNIYYIESDMRIIHIHESSISKSIYMKLDDMEKELTGNFLRCHQSYIVNMDKVMKITNESLMLFNGVNIPISRSKKKEVFEKLYRYLGID